MSKCGKKCDVYSRVTGYHQPLHKWNIGKKEEFKQRKPYAIQKQSTNAVDVCKAS